ncbi:MAG: hypothetical protein WC844_02530 [Patescibacteria group bacterium]|jgi:serine/threonine protein kinase
MPIKTGYQDICDKLSLIIEKVFLDDDQTGGRFLAQGLIGSEKVFLKITAKSDTWTLYKFRREIASFDAMKKLFPSGNELFSKIPAVIGSGESGDFFWVLRSYCPGETLAQYSQTPGRPLVYEYSLIKDKFLGDYVQILGDTISFLDSIREHDPEAKGVDFSNEFLRPQFPRDLSTYDIKMIESEIGFSLQPQLDFYNSYSETYFSRERLSVITGDLVPTNIIIKEDSSLVLTDFEWFIFDNFMMDIAQLWLYLYRYPVWQKELVGLGIKTKDDEECFRASLIRLVVGNGWHKVLSAEKHQWIEYLRRAGQSYSSLVG